MPAPIGFAIAGLLATLVVASFPPTAAPVHGIRCDQMESTNFHIHAHLAVFDHGKPVGVPSDVGRPILAGCLYWLHTHTSDGIIHVESPVVRSFTLGDFFAIWGEPLTKTQVASAKVRPGEQLAVWVNGARVAGDPRAIPLAQHTEITIDAGPPIRKPEPFTGWGNL